MKGSVLFRNRGAGSLRLGLGETEEGEVGGRHRQRSTWLGLDRILSDTLARGSPCQWLACPLSFVPQRGTREMPTGVGKDLACLNVYVVVSVFILLR